MGVLEIAGGLSAALLEIEGLLRVYTFVPGTLSPPAAFVSWAEVDYDQDMSDDHLVRFTVHLVVANVNDRTAYEALNPYLDGEGALSIKAAIEDDSTLGGTASSTRVTEARVRPITIADVDYIGASFTVECYSALVTPTEP